MRQVLHIFSKDARRLRYDVLVTLVLTAIFAWSVGHSRPVLDWQASRFNRVAELLKLFLPLAWWYLVARAIYEEPLPGDRQFWVTRPYRWPSLIGAKVLFIAAFVILPLLVSDCVILALQGFHPSTHLAGLAWHPLIFSVIFLLPVAALACITVSIAQMALAVLAAIAFISVLSLFDIGGSTLWFGSLGWVRDSVMFLVLLFGGLAIMILQYRSRRTGLARILAGAVAGLVMITNAFLPWTVASALQLWVIKSRVDTSSIWVQFQPGGHPPTEASQAAVRSVRVSLPLGFSGVSPGMVVVVDGMAAQLVLPDGTLSEQLPMGGTEKDKPWYTMSVERSLYERVKNTSLRVHVTVLFTLYGNLHTERMPLDGNSHRLPGIGVCVAEPIESTKTTAVRCLVPFRLPARTLAQFDNGAPEEGWGANPLSPYPADFGLSPLDEAHWQLTKQAGATAIVFTLMQPLAHIRRDLDIPNVQLVDFAH